MVSSEQIIKGLARYADAEVLPHLSTSGKWIAGTAVAMALKNASGAINALQTNEALKMIGALNSDGLFNVDDIAASLRETADRYGKLVIDIPIVGTMTFNGSDVDTLAGYIRGER